MKKYMIIYIICFAIVLGIMIYVFLPKIQNIGTSFLQNTEGTRVMSQSELRAQSVGEVYISEEVREYNKNVVHSEEDEGLHEEHNGAPILLEEETSVYSTPIYGGEEVAKFFENSSHYYYGEIKLEEAFYNYIPEVLKETSDMTNSGLSDYFANNADLIEAKLGIVSPEEFVKFIGSMDKLKGKKYTRISIPSNAITENYTTLAINFLIELTLEDGSKVYPVSIALSHLKKSVNQEAPYIQFFGLYNSQRAE